MQQQKKCKLYSTPREKMPLGLHKPVSDEWPLFLPVTGRSSRNWSHVAAEPLEAAAWMVRGPGGSSVVCGPDLKGSAANLLSLGVSPLSKGLFPEDSRVDLGVNKEVEPAWKAAKEVETAFSFTAPHHLPPQTWEASRRCKLHVYLLMCIFLS